MSKRRKKDERPFWTGDAETDPFKYGRVPRPFIWGLYTGFSFQTFARTEDFVEAIRDQEVIVYFHNGGKFDIHLGLLKYVNLEDGLKIIDGRIVSAKLGRAEIRDSFSLFPAPLKEFGFKKDIEIWKLESGVRKRHMGEIVEYLKQDCVGLWDALHQHEQTYGRHLTQASASLKAWERIGEKVAPKSDRAFFKKFRKFYYGGRVQCFRKGVIEGPVHVVDIRSAYPWAMLTPHPYATAYVEIAWPKQVQPSDMVTLDAVSLGALPWRDEKGIMRFPDDDVRRRYHVPGHEVIAGIETGTLRNVQLVNAIRFSGQQDFGAYVHHFYDHPDVGRKAWRARARAYREAGDELAAMHADVEVFFCKRYMTGLYGKLAANPDNYGEFIAIPWDDKYLIREDGYEFNGRLGPYALMRRPLDPWQQHFLNIAGAASITSKVRAHLWRAIRSCDDPVYCDTDCVMTRGAMPPVEIGEELGQWSYEGEASEAHVAGKKLYYLKGRFENGKSEKMASKGVKPDPAKIRQAAAGQTAIFESDAPTFTLKPRKDGSNVYFQQRKVRMT